MGLATNQIGYYKCDLCMAAGDLSKKDVYFTSANGKPACRCAAHGGSGKPAVRPSADVGDDSSSRPVMAAKRPRSK